MHEPIVITGWGQATQRKDAVPPWADPIDLMEQAVRAFMYMANYRRNQDTLMETPASPVSPPDAVATAVMV